MIVTNPAPTRARVITAVHLLHDNAVAVLAVPDALTPTITRARDGASGRGRRYRPRRPTLLHGLPTARSASDPVLSRQRNNRERQRPMHHASTTRNTYRKGSNPP